MPDQGNRRRPKQTEADLIQYAPAAPTDWTERQPSNVQAAIDLLGDTARTVFIGPIPPANPKEGTLWYDTSEIGGFTMGALPLTAFGDLRIAELSPIYQGSFEYTVDNTLLNTNTQSGSGAVSQADAMAIVGTGTTTGSTAKFQSKQHAKYRAGLGGLSRFTALFTSPVAATEQYIGLADEAGSSASFKNGYMIGYDGVTFGLHRFQNDVKFTTAVADWDDPLDGSGESGITIDPTKLNVFFIQFEYLGSGPINIYMQDDNTDRIWKVHTEDYANANVVPSVYNPNFHHVMWVANKATTDNLILKSASYAYFVEGKTTQIELHQPMNGTGVVVVGSVTTEVPLLTIRNKAEYAGKTNFIDVLLFNLLGSIEAANANNLASVRLVKNATLGGDAASWSDISATDSVIEVDTSRTTISGGRDLTFAPLAGKNDKIESKLIDMREILNPGDTLTLAGTSAGSATFNVGLNWRELF